MAGVQAALSRVLHELGLEDEPVSAQQTVQRLLMAHGDLEKGLRLVASLPAVRVANVVLDAAALRATLEVEAATVVDLEATLRALGPWRKGPFSIQSGDDASLLLDAEWRSDLKWQRVLDLGVSFAGRRVLDVGTGNGYFLWRLRGAGARRAVGLEPSLRSVLQFLALSRVFPQEGCALWPLRLEDLPGPLEPFDTVMSMGVLYHQRDPVEHLRQLGALLAPLGELILETIVVRSSDAIHVAAGQRYAGMRNVYVVPTERIVLAWLEQAGLELVRAGRPVLVTSAEQRKTSWSPGPSLEDFLEVSPLDPDGEGRRTREGHGRPWRQIFVARARGRSS